MKITIGIYIECLFIFLLLGEHFWVWHSGDDNASNMWLDWYPHWIPLSLNYAIVWIFSAAPDHGLLAVPIIKHVI